MTLIRLLTVLLLIFLFSCKSEQQLPADYAYAYAPDTIRLSLSKVAGRAPFGFGYGQCYFFDTTEFSYPPLVFPEKVSNLKISSISTDLKPHFLKLYQQGVIDERHPSVPTVLQAIKKGKIDTANLLAATDYSVYLISAKRNEDAIFIVDENGNRDLTDDPVRILGNLEPESFDDLIQCVYPIYNDHEFVTDTGWIKLGCTEMWPVAIGEAFYHSATFSIAERTYRVGVTPDEYGGFSFTGNPTLALLAIDGKDVAPYHPPETRIELGQYVKLGPDHYQFHGISNDGRLMTLIREPDFDRQTGIQTGLLAPDFSCITTEGRTISSDAIGDCPLLITNLTACGSGTLKDYQAIIAAAAGKIQVLAMEPHPGKDRPGLVVDTEDERNRLFHETYRKDYSSRVCYLIGPDRRLLEKFDIHHWEEYLPYYLVP